jgi:RND family efflux transporter MFP subunit
LLIKLPQTLDSWMNLFLKVLIPVLILVGCVFAAKKVFDNRPEPRTRPSFPTVQAVEAITLSKSQYPVMLRSQGTVQPTQLTTLVSEVNGSITAISDVFVVGGEFNKGDVLLQLDERDYTIALTQAQASLAQASAQLQEEAARAELAKAEWQSLGRKANAFNLRQPQVAAARANRDAARAQVERAKLDLERTRFIAPFDGRVLEKNVDLGQFVSRGSRIGQLYTTASVDVKLPLSSKQLTYLDIPTPGSGSNAELPSIELNANVGGVPHVWNGKVIRAEGVDASTQQLNIIARIDEPFAQDKPQLRIGQFVNAKIAGRVLDDVFVVPRAAVREDREVLLVNGQSQLERREVNIAWADDETAAIKDDGLTGAVLVTTAMSTVTNGTPVRATVDGVEPPPRRRGAGRPGAEGQPGTAGRPAGEGRPAGGGQRGGQGGQGADGQARGEGRGQAGEGRPAGQRRPDGQRPAAGQQRGNGNWQGRQDGGQQGERRRPQGQNQPANANS